MKKYSLSITNELAIPIIDIGNCKADFACFICQLHGDEFACQKIIATLLASPYIESLENIRIIACANPAGAAQGIKNEPYSNRNLNRLFGTSETLPQPTRELLNSLLKLVSGSRFCIDLHDMPGSRLPISAILTCTNQPGIETKSLDLLKRFNPSVYWLEDFSQPDVATRYQGTLNSVLNQIGIPNFSIETSCLEALTPSDTKAVCSKLIQLLSSSPTSPKSILVDRVEVRAPESGFITPSPLKLLSRIVVNQTLGTLETPNQKIPILSSATGLLIRQVLPKSVQQNEKLFDIGIPL